MDKQRIGNRIKSIRLALGLSMEEFATRIDQKAKSGTVSNWETGKNLPNNERLKRIAGLGNTTVDELLYQKSKEEYELRALKAFAADLQRVTDEFDLRYLNSNAVVRELKDLLNSLNETLGEINK